MKFDIEFVGKVGSIALLNEERTAIDHKKLKQLASALRPGYVWVTSGAVEIGKLDYFNRTGRFLEDTEESKNDYAGQGQSILMTKYREYIDQKYSTRQILLEHFHLNDSAKRQHLRDLLLRCPKQNAIPIINYNDTISSVENRKMEIATLAKYQEVHECVDNDETASQIACLLKSKYLVIFTSVDGIYLDHTDKNTLIQKISGKNCYELVENIEHYKQFCIGSSRKGANGAGHKLEYIKPAAMQGTTIYIANSKYSIEEVLSEKIACTKICVE